MKTVKTVAAARALLRRVNPPVVLVPTMGALHEGHASLIRLARQVAGPSGTVAVSIFVNPTQFGPKEDLSRYPRPLRQDLALCRREGVDVVFTPSVDEMYPSNASVAVDEGELSQFLCGASRPGHFRGVCTIVAKLFLSLFPDAAVFGEKDWQQLAIIQRMVRDLNFPIRIVGHPIVRESDGLAVSSRNAYLTLAERAEAPRIFAALSEAAGKRGRTEILRTATKALAAIPGARVDYLELVDAETLQPVKTGPAPARLAAAVFFGSTRLIDNVAVERF